MADQLMAEADEFQSTHPARGCDARLMRLSLFKKHFNPRTPQGGATTIVKKYILLTKFQSTHPARGCDVGVILTATFDVLFQSTHPARGCDTFLQLMQLLQLGISIHAPRKGVRHAPPTALCGEIGYFNPRTPQGGATF